MTDEKTIEELKLELKTLKQKNLEIELLKEKEKLLKAEEEKQSVEREKLKSQLREEVMQEFAEKSNIVKAEKPVGMNKPVDNLQEFAQKYIKRNKLTGLKYEDLVKRLVDGDL